MYFCTHRVLLKFSYWWRVLSVLQRVLSVLQIITDHCPEYVDCCPMFFFNHVPSCLSLLSLPSLLSCCVLLFCLLFGCVVCCRVIVVFRCCFGFVFRCCCVCHVVARWKPSSVHSKRCIFKTSPCVPVRTCLKHVLVVSTCGRGVGTHGYVLNVHTGTRSMHSPSFLQHSNTQQQTHTQWEHSSNTTQKTQLRSTEKRWKRWKKRKRR